MGLKKQIVARFFGNEIKEAAVSSSLDLFRQLYSAGAQSNSGEPVSWKTALQQSTVLACARVIANGISQVPFRVYLDVGNGKEIAADHPLFQLLYRRPNAWQTSYEFRETIVFHLLLCGNAFVFANRVGRARTIRELVPIEPGRVEVEQNSDLSLTYWVRGKDNQRNKFGSDAIWHLRGPSWNTWMGLEAVRLARESIGLSMALERSQATFHKYGARVSGVLSVKDKLGKDKFEELAAWLDRHEIGGDRENKPLIADMSAEWKSLTMTGVDAQHLETRKHQIEEICREFGVMPIMVGHADKTATYASAEQMFLAHVIHTLAPWYQRIEQSADVNLLSEEDRARGYYTKFSPDALMRGATRDQAEYFSKALGSGNGKGWLTQNMVLGMLDLPRSTDPRADELPQPPASTQVAKPDPKTEDDPPEEEST